MIKEQQLKMTSFIQIQKYQVDELSNIAQFISDSLNKQLDSFWDVFVTDNATTTFAVKAPPAFNNHWLNWKN